MFGTNEIVGAKFFNEAPKDSLFVTSIFYTLQGEGPYSGRPCVFVRLAKCNLACSFCDTLFDVGQWMTFTEIRAKIYSVVCDYWNTKGLEVPLWALPKGSVSGQWGVSPAYGFGLVLTGGEPLLQDNVSEFLDQSLSRFEWIQVESNGTRNCNLPVGTTLVVSPKCIEKDGIATRYLTPSYLMIERADCLKFVMCAPPAVDPYTFVDHFTSPYESIPEWAHDWAARTQRPVYVSPMNVYLEKPKAMRVVRSKEANTLDVRSTEDEKVSFWETGVLNMRQNQANHEYAAQYALTHGFRFQLQAHLYASLA